MVALELSTQHPKESPSRRQLTAYVALGNAQMNCSMGWKNESPLESR